MKQRILSAARRETLRRQLGTPDYQIAFDDEVLERIFSAKAVAVWEGTAFALDNADELLHEGLAALRAREGWETQCAALLLLTDTAQSDAFSLAQVDALAGQVLETAQSFTIGTATAALDVGALRLVLVTAEEPVRAPERLTRLTLGALTLLVGGEADERADQLGDCMSGADFADSLAEAAMVGGVDEFRADWCTVPELVLAEAHTLEGRPAAEEMLSDILLRRYYDDLPSLLGMQYLPAFLAKWFPMEGL